MRRPPSLRPQGPSLWRRVKQGRHPSRLCAPRSLAVWALFGVTPRVPGPSLGVAFVWRGLCAVGLRSDRAYPDPEWLSRTGGGCACGPVVEALLRTDQGWISCADECTQPRTERCGLRLEDRALGLSCGRGSEHCQGLGVSPMAVPAVSRPSERWIRRRRDSGCVPRETGLLVRGLVQQCSRRLCPSDWAADSRRRQAHESGAGTEGALRAMEGES